MECLDWRCLTRDDVPALARLLVAAEEVDHTGEHYDEQDLHEEFDGPDTSPENFVGGWRGDELVAYAALDPRPGVVDFQRIGGEGTVAPHWRGRGAGSQGVEWILRRSKELHDTHHPELVAKVHVRAELDAPDQVDLLQQHGFSAVNWSALMRANLERARSAVTEPPWPDGLTLHHYSDAWSAATLAAHNAAFVDHWSFIPWTESRWQQWVDGTKNRRDDVSWVVVDDAEPDVVVGYLLSDEYEVATVATGRREAYLAKIGVRRQLRGRGIASSLLAHALREYAARGYQDSALDVDTANASGAFALYERLGYTVERRAATFEFLIPPRP